MRAGLHHREVDAGVAAVELDQGGCQHVGDQAGGGPDREPAPGHARQGAGLGPGGLGVGQHALDEGQQRGAVGRGRDQALPGAAVEEQHPQLALEQADLAAERRLGQVQAGGGPGEVLLLGHGEHVGQLVQFHARRV